MAKKRPNSMKCFECEKGNLIHRRAQVEGEVRSEQFVVESAALVCDRCGYQAMEGADLPEHLRRLADAYRRAHRLLTSEEIRSRRGLLRMTQKVFAAYLGVGEASIKRWELGAVQDESMDRYIRLKTDPEEAELNAQQVAQLMRA
jgi:putative zinc finger/helix-turn-helix YgiT family protein